MKTGDDSENKFRFNDSRWPLVSVLVWIATRSEYPTVHCAGRRVDAADSWLALKRTYSDVLPGDSASGAWDNDLAPALDNGSIQGVATRCYIQRIGQASYSPGERFPPIDRPSLSSSLRIESAREENRSVLRSKGDYLAAGYQEWRDVTFARADVLRLWPENQDALTRRLEILASEKSMRERDAYIPLFEAVALLAFGRRLSSEELHDHMNHMMQDPGGGDRDPRSADERYLAANKQVCEAARSRRLTVCARRAADGQTGPQPRIFGDLLEVPATSFIPEILIGHSDPFPLLELGGIAALSWFHPCVEYRQLMEAFPNELRKISETDGSNSARGTVKGIARCRDWLVSLREAGGQKKTKHDYKVEAMAEFSIGPDQFRQAWEQASMLVPSERWGRKGRPKGTIKSSGNNRPAKKIVP